MRLDRPVLKASAALEVPAARTLDSSRLAFWTFLCAAIPFGLAVLLFTPPFQGADEPQHFLRAYAISEGQLFAENIAGAGGNELPVNLLEVIRPLGIELPYKVERRAELNLILDELAVPLAADQRGTVHFPGSAIYFPVVYAPQSVGMAIGRALGLGPMALLYVGRLLSLALGIALIGWAIRRTPTHAFTFTLLALLPVSVFGRSMLSADALTIGLGWVFLVLVLRLAYAGDVSTRRTVVALFAVGLILALSKQVYFVAALLLLLVPAERLGGRLRFWATFAALLLIMLGVALLWSGHVSGQFPANTANGANLQAQLAHALREPFDAAAAFIRSIVHRRVYYLETAVARLGWLDVYFPRPIMWTLSAALLLVTASDPGPARFDRRARASLAVTFTLSALAVLGVMYLTWTAVGDRYIAGVQGRYFLPLGPALLLSLHAPRLFAWMRDEWRGMVLALAIWLSFSSTLWRIYLRYWEPL